MSPTNDQMDEVWSWIHNERRCVTIQTVSLTLGLPRSEASLVLAKLPSYKSGDHSYECTKCCMSQKDGKTVIKLDKSIVSGNDMDTDNDDSIVYSLALVDTESVYTAHEKDMAQFRDMLKEEDSPQASATSSALDPTLHQHSIKSEEYGNVRLTAFASQQQRLSGRVMEAPDQAAMPKASSSRPSKPARKATTAANFFAAKPLSKSKDTKKPAKKKSKVEKKPASKKEKKAASKKDDEPQAMDVDEEPIDDTAAAADVEIVQEEKENSINKKVGNADDFVGDEDEDEDFLEAERERKRRNAAREKKQRSKKKEQVPVEEEEDDEPVVKVHGAMDAFAQHQEKKPQETRTKKRRKKLVEKTTMDKNGYIHTETQAVWEEVEEDEEPAPAKAAPVKKAPVKNTKNMKQGNLMGFFKKK